MSNLLTRHTGLLNPAEPRVTAPQLQTDALMQGFSNQSGGHLLAMSGASLFGRALGLGCAALGSQAGLSYMATRALYHSSSLFSEVAVYRGLLHGPRGTFERDGFANDLLNFSVLRVAGGMCHGTNPIAVHALQSGSMVFAQNVAHEVGLTHEAPQGSLLSQLFQAEAFNLQQTAAMGLLHHATGGRILSAERRMKAELDSRIASLRQASSARALLPGNGLTRMHSELENLIKERDGMSMSAVENAARSIPFLDPISCLRNPCYEFQVGMRFAIAEAYGNLLVGRVDSVEILYNKTAYRVIFELNGETIGNGMIQPRPAERELVWLNLEIDPELQGMNIGKTITLYHLYQAHLLSWRFTRDLITNPKLIQTAGQPFERGERMYLGDAKVQKLVSTLDPWEPELLPLGEALPLYETDTSAWVPSNFQAFRITGTPNPVLFRNIDARRSAH